MGEPAMSFNPFEYIDELVKGGFTQQQAEAQAKAQIKLIHDLSENHLATKQDLKDLEIRMDTRFNQVDNRIDHLEHLIDKQFLKITVSSGALLMGAVTILTILMKFLGQPL